MNLIALAGVM